VGATAAEVLQRGIDAAVARILEHEPVIREDCDPEGVHQARVGLRRIRSDLRTFGELVEPTWAEAVRAESGWLAGVLGEVRDRDVLLVGLRAAADRVEPVDRAAVDAVLDRLARERARAQRGLLAALAGRRHQALLERLAEPVPVADGADRRAADGLPSLAAAAHRKLRRAVARLPEAPDDDALHRVRIRAKRARYAAELAAPIVGRRANRAAKAVGGLQEVLGRHHDHVVAAAWLRHALPTASRPQAYAIGLLVADQVAAADACRGGWSSAWSRAERAGRDAWRR
jgi:CHAD domain-containing protein